MKTFQIKNEPKKLYFQNYDRIDESVIFDNARDVINRDSSFLLGAKFETPLEIIQEFNFQEKSLELVNDINYGVYIFCLESDMPKELIEKFN